MNQRMCAPFRQGEAYKQAFRIFLDHTDQKRNAKRWLQEVVDTLPTIFFDLL